MSDSNLSYKISETITNVFKKTKLFEKIEKIQILVGSFVIISSLIGITSIYMHHSTLSKICEISEKQQENITDIIEINTACCIRKLEDKINQIDFRLSILLENQKNMINEIKNLQIYKIQEINVTTSKTLLTPIKHNDKVNIFYEKVENIVNNEGTNKLTNNLDNKFLEYKDDEDNELINECYDNIPLSNIKKTTGLNWFFK